MVVTNNADFAKKVRMLRDWGAEKKYHHVLKGYNYRLEGIQGAVLRVKLRHLEAWTEARRKAAALYDRGLMGSGVVVPHPKPHDRHVYHVYAIRTKHRQAWQDALNCAGHSDRHPLSVPRPSAARVLEPRLQGRATSRMQSERRTRCCRCRCSRSSPLNSARRLPARSASSPRASSLRLRKAMPITDTVKLGRDVRIFHPSLVNLYGCTVGDDSRIGAFVEIQKNSSIGARCKISSHTFICEGVTIEDEVFIGHGVMFTNDIYPRATNHRWLGSIRGGLEGRRDAHLQASIDRLQRHDSRRHFDRRGRVGGRRRRRHEGRAALRHRRWRPRQGHRRHTQEQRLNSP